ncbi:hypothetical protein LSH36_61g08001 [Paralvinella palmiformis]|uniref:PKD/REJ-like domain-containing protein n=1 Tax=Paralvinella palmiformis TaxID=53620 RepID=A0AAD9NDI7_9ANNE|nr:hypothetical protein LSH36_61g08001 [Paralvinella palmiformis]
MSTYKAEIISISGKNRRLKAMTYLWSVLVTVMWDDDTTVTKTVTTTTTMASRLPVAVIRGQPEYTVGSSADIILDSSGSYDPDNSGTVETYTWTCTDVNNDTVCNTTDGNVLQMPTESSGTIRASELVPNTDYLFCVYVTFEGRTSESPACVKVYVVQGTPPEVEIISVPSIQPTTKILVINGRVCSPPGNDTYVKMSWSGVDKVGSVLFDMTAHCQPNMFGQSLTFIKDATTRCKTFPLICSGGLDHGSTYTFKLDAIVTDAEGIPLLGESVSESTADYVTAPEPYIGGIEVTPTNDTITSLDVAVIIDLGSISATDQNYRFYMKKNSGEVYWLTSKRTDITYKCYLPSGIIILGVEAENQYGVVVTKETSGIEVAAKYHTAAELTARYQSSSDIMGLMTSILWEYGNSSDIDIKTALSTLLSNAVSNTLSTINTDNPDFAVQTAKQAFTALKFDDQPMSESVKTQMKSVLVQLTAIYASSSTSRKKRAVDTSDDICMTDDVMNTLVSGHAQILQSDPGLVSSVDTFLQDVDSYMAASCRGACMVYGQPSIAVSYSLTNVRIRKYSFTSSNFASDVILNNCNVCEGCSNCSDVVNRTAEITLGSELKQIYEDWLCDGSTSCEGACVGSVELNYDLISQTGTSSNLTRRSHLIEVHLMNPETGQHMTHDLTTAYTVRMPIDGVLYNNIILTQTMAAQVQVMTKITQQAALPQVGIVSLSVSFKFSDSYSQIIPDAATKTSLQIYIRPQLADMMNVTLTRITDVSLSQGGTSQASLSAALSNINSAIQNGILVIQTSSGTYLTFQPGSLSYRQPTGTGTIDLDENRVFEAGAVVGIVFGVILFVVIFIVAVILIFKKCSSSKYNDEEIHRRPSEIKRSRILSSAECGLNVGEPENSRYSSGAGQIIDVSNMWWTGNSIRGSIPGGSTDQITLNDGQLTPLDITDKNLRPTTSSTTSSTDIPDAHEWVLCHMSDGWRYRYDIILTYNDGSKIEYATQTLLVRSIMTVADVPRRQINSFARSAAKHEQSPVEANFPHFVISPSMARSVGYDMKSIRLTEDDIPTIFDKLSGAKPKRLSSLMEKLNRKRVCMSNNT